MKKRFKKLALAYAVLLLFLCAGLQAASGFYINGGKLFDANGNQFVMRGVSHAHTWYTDRTASAIVDIKSVKANTVRVVLSSGNHGEGWPRNEASDVANVINLCKTNRLVAMLECHDTTGYKEKTGAQPMSVAVAYWKSIQSVLTGQEKYVLINIGNEPYGNTGAAGWVNDTKSAIQSMRSAGFTHTLVVDAGNWGQDWEYYMRDNAQSVFDADSAQNTILSIHMYGVFKSDAVINKYITSIIDKGLPLIIGEFGNNHSDGDPDEDSIMYRALQYNIGYIGWSWCGNSGGVEYLDMVNSWNVSSLTTWGDRIINGANGLKAKSIECSVYSGTAPVFPGPDPTPRPPVIGLCSSFPVWTASAIYDQTGTRVYHNGFIYENAWYTTNQNPDEFSDVNEVWKNIGICEGGNPTATPTVSRTITRTPTPSPTPTRTSSSTGLKGDVNSDNTINIVDALMTAQYSVGLNPANFNAARADVNCDSQVTIVDALMIAQFYVGLISSFPC